MKNFKSIFLLLVLSAFGLQAHAQQPLDQQQIDVLKWACKLSNRTPGTAFERKLAQLLDPIACAKACSLLEANNSEGAEDLIHQITQAVKTANEQNDPNFNSNNNNHNNNNNDPNQNTNKADLLSGYEKEVLGLACKLFATKPDPKNRTEVQFANLLTMENRNKACNIVSGNSRKGNETLIRRILDSYESIKSEQPPAEKKIPVYHTDTYPMLKQPEKMALDAACKICEKAGKSEASLSAYDKSFIDLMMEPIGDLPGMNLCEFGGEKNYACFVLAAAGDNVTGKGGYEDFISKVVTVQNYLKNKK